MVSKYDLLYVTYLNDGSDINTLLTKLKKTKVEYPAFYKHLINLKKENLVESKDNAYFITNQNNTKTLISLIDYCVKNNIDYNQMFLSKTIDFIKAGFENKLDRLKIDNKTRSRISKLLTKHGFLIVLYKKPFKAQLVYSRFLELLLKYFEPEFKFDKNTIYSQVDEELINSQIEKEFSKYKKNTKKITIDDEIKFIHQSLSLEGNMLTLPETEKLIKQNIPSKNKSFKDMEDIVNYKRALDFFVGYRKLLNFETVLEFHRIAMQTVPEIAGKVRKQNVVIKGNPYFKTPNWKELPIKLKDFFDDYSNAGQKKLKAHQIIEFATQLHSDFQRIHPFIDGNSRTSRAVFVHTLLLNGFPLVKFLPGFVDQYMELTKLSKERNDTHFKQFMTILVLESLKQANVVVESE